MTEHERRSTGRTTPGPDGPSPARLREFACYARIAVAAGQQASLVISGMGLVPPRGEDAMLYDLTGEPHLVCGSTSPILQAAGRTAQLTITADLSTDTAPLAPGRMTAILSGRLTPAACQRAAPPGATTIALRVATVVLELHTGSARRAQYVIPPDLYLGAPLDPTRSYVIALTAHTNTHHQDELRHRVAEITGTGIGGIAGASVSDVTLDGARLHWVDLTGAHTLTLRFPYTATDPVSLTHLLRRALIGPTQTDR
jgi:hypothetical protein